MHLFHVFLALRVCHSENVNGCHQITKAQKGTNDIIVNINILCNLEFLCFSGTIISFPFPNPNCELLTTDHSKITPHHL